MATTYAPPSPPFIEARHYGGSQTPKAIVMHGTVSSDNAGTARNVAERWHGSSSPVTSAHYIVDPKETIQAVGDHRVAYHCGYNTGSIAIELCDEQTGPASRWQDTDSQAIIKRAARLTAELCLAYGIAAKRPSVAELKAKGPHGIYGHNDSRLAFGRTTHVDPKEFPWAQFLNLVNAEIVKIKAAKAGIVAAPAPAAAKRSGVNSFVTQNVCSLPEMTQARVLHDVNLTASQGTVIGWQEIGPARYKDAIRKLDPKVWESYIARPADKWYNSPISWKKGSWALITKGSWLLHKGVSGVTGNRYLTWVILRSRSTGALVLFQNVHYVPKAWNGKVDDHEALRKKMWTDGAARQRAWNGFMMKAYPMMGVVGFGDYNRPARLGPAVGKTLHARPVRLLVGSSSIDHIWICDSKDGKVRFEAKGHELLPGRFSDHQGRRGRVVVVHKV